MNAMRTPPAGRPMTLLMMALFIVTLLGPLIASQPASLSEIATYSSNTRIASVDFSPSLRLYAVAKENGEIEVLASNMTPLADYKVPNPYFIQAKFLGGLLAVVWEHGGYTLTLINVSDWSRRDIELVGDTGQLVAALRFNRSLYLFLFKKALLAVDVSRGAVVKAGDTPFTIVNTGVTLFKINGSRIALVDVNTRCPFCILNNDKELVIFDQKLRIINRLTLHHFLYAYPVSNGSEILVIRDNGKGEFWSPFPLSHMLGKTPIHVYTPGREKIVFTRGAAAIYSSSGNTLTIKIFYPATLTWRRVTAPLPGVKKIAKSEASLSEEGLAALLLKGIGASYLVAADCMEGVKGYVKLPPSANLAGVRGKTVIVATPYKALFYSFTAPSAFYNVTMRVTDDNGTPLGDAEVYTNGTVTKCPQGICVLRLKPGTHGLRIGAPGFHWEDIVLNVTSNMAVDVKLHRVLYTVEITVKSDNGTPIPANLTVYTSDGRRLYGGAAPARLLVPGGSYRVVARYRGAENSTLLDVSSNASLTLELAVRRVLTVIPPRGVRLRLVIEGVSGVVYNSTVTGPVSLSLPGGHYVVEGYAEGYKSARVEVTLTKDMEVRLAMEPLNREELSAVIYGLSGCPHCREVNSTLRRLLPHVEFREISTRKYAEEYEELYRVLKAGNRGLVPLTLVFQGDRLILAVVGGGDAEWWRSTLSQAVEGKVLVVDDVGHKKLLEVNQSLIREIVFGGSARIPKRHTALLPLVVSLAAADSVNPCTFLVFTALLIMTMRISGRGNMLLAAAAFIAAVYTAYMLLGLGLLKVFSSLPWLKYLLAALAFIFGAQSLYSVRGGEFHSPVPARWKKLIEEYLSRIARSGSPVLAFTLGIIISLTLLPCSSGPYLVAMYALSTLPFTLALLYLVLYNAIFVAPLVAITVSVGLASGKVRALMKTRTRLPKYFEAAAGILLIAIGVYVLLYM